MVILHLANVRKIPETFTWFNPRLIITPAVKREVEKVSKRNPMFGNIDIQQYIQEGLLTLHELQTQEETVLFHGYYNFNFGATKFNEGESSCLAVAVANEFGIACDEVAVLDEFKSEMKKKKLPHTTHTTRSLIRFISKQGFIDKAELANIEQALFSS